MPTQQKIATPEAFNIESKARGWNLTIDQGPIANGQPGWRIYDADKLKFVASAPDPSLIVDHAMNLAKRKEEKRKEEKKCS